MSAYSDLVRADGPSLFWALDATNGATDLSGNSRSGTGTGGVSIGGYTGSPLSDVTTSTDFDDTDDRVESSYNPFSGGTSRTIMGWAYRDTSTTNDGLFGGFAAAGPFLQILANTNDVRFNPQFGVATATTWSSAWPGTAQWVHWALIFNDSADTVELFINGATVSSQAQTTSYAASPGNFYLGAVLTGINPWDGKMAGVAVFERALAASTIRDYYNAATRTSPTIRIREAPPLRLMVSVQPPSGQPYRWGKDEPKAANVPSDISFSSTAPGGFESFSATLPRKPDLTYSDLERLSNLCVQGAGGQILWEGRLEQSPRVSGQSMAVNPSAVGWQAHLDDNKSAKMVYIDRDLGRWQDPSTQRKINRETGGYKYGNGEWNTGFQDGGANAPGIFQTISRIASTSGSVRENVETWYYSGGSDIGQIRYDYDNVANINSGDTSWNTTAYLSSDDIATSIDSGTDHNGVDATDSSVSASTTGRKYALLQLEYTATFTGDGSWVQQWRNIRVLGNHGLTRRGTAPADGYYASDVIAHVLSSWCPFITYSTGSTGSIVPTAFVIPQLAFYDYTTASDMISSANRFHLRDWFVWEGSRPGLPTFYYHDRGARGKAWRARVGPSKLSEAGPQMDRLWNGVIVQYNDVDGSTRSVGPSGSGANSTSTSLVDTDPLNPANKLGIRRWTILDMNGISTAAGATEVGRRFLAEQKLLNTSGQAELTGYVEDDRGIRRPASQIRAGDTISFVDAADTSARRIVKTSYSDASKTCSVDLDSPPDGLDALLERLQVVLVPLGL